MILVTNGSTAEVIQEMKDLKHRASVAAKPIFHAYSAKEIEHGVPSDTAKRLIKTHNHRQQWYRVTHYTPAYLAGVMVDYKFLSRFLRYLRGFTLRLEKVHEGLHLVYEKGFDTTRQSGVLVLYDLTQYYGDLTKVPTIELEGVEIQ